MTLTTIQLDDWCGIYGDDGKLLMEGHSIDYRHLLMQLGYNIRSEYIENDDLSEFGNCLPQNVSDIIDYIKRKQS